VRHTGVTIGQTAPTGQIWQEDQRGEEAGGGGPTGAKRGGISGKSAREAGGTTPGIAGRSRKWGIYFAQPTTMVWYGIIGSVTGAGARLRSDVPDR